jgi:superfamily II DNA/RNA helicase
MRFDELDLSDDILDALDAMHFEECTPIQEKAIDVVLDGRDLIAVAQTGTGKTAAYLLPVIDILASRENVDNAIRCVVMVPTHELAQQIDRQLAGFSYYLPISSVAIHGGTDGKEFARQQKGLTSGADVVIATPGRLLAHMKMGYVDLSHVEHFILDEADRMLDMGFYDDIAQIASKLPKERQTLMFSATMPQKIQQLAASILNDPVEVKIAVSKPTDKIDQSAYVLYENQKEGVLKHIFKSGNSKRVIVFASSKLKVKDLARSLRKAGWKAGEMHSDLDQPAREEVMNNFRAGRIDILVATDVVARGIDIQDIALVVNYDVPHEAEDYVHRIGRTARANADGMAITFISEKDQSKFRYIERFLGYEVKKNPVPEEFGKTPEYGGIRPHGKSGNRRRQSSGRKPKQQAEPKPKAENANGNKDNGKRRRRYHKRPKSNKE